MIEKPRFVSNNATGGLSDLSRLVHDALFSGPSQSLCARAWERRSASVFWAAWVRVFGARHCRASWEWWRGR